MSLQTTTANYHAKLVHLRVTVSGWMLWLIALYPGHPMFFNVAPLKKKNRHCLQTLGLLTPSSLIFWVISSM